MTDVISVRFKDRGKVYFFAANGVEASPGDQLVVETAKGLETGVCAIGSHPVEDDRIIQPLRPVIRTATEDDLRVVALNKEREREAFGICEDKIAKHKLDMKLVDVECNFEGNKIVFFFTSDGRVDFRELVKDLASVFRTRIELRQIGVRDEAKMLGGLGICGRPFCCSQFLDDFQPVSTKMAKTQYMSMNPSKISGSCGRLMCCLRYEQDAYEDLVRHSPKAGAFVETPDGYGIVVQLSLLRQQLKVKIDGPGDDVVKSYDVDEVAVVPGGRPKPGEPLPKVLQIKPKEEKAPEPQEDIWVRPNLFAYETAEAAPVPAAADAPDDKKREPQKRRRGKPKHKAPGEPRPAEARAVEVKPAEHRPKRPDGKKQEGRKPEQPKKQDGQNKKPEQAKRPQAQGRKPEKQPAAAEAVKAQPKKTGNPNRRRYNKPRPKPADGQQGGSKE